MTTKTLGRRCASFTVLIVLGLGGATAVTESAVRADTAVFSRSTAQSALPAQR